MKTKTMWQTASKRPLWGFLLFSFAGFITFICAVLSKLSSFSSFAQDDYNRGPNLLDTLSGMKPFLVLFGYFLFTLSLRKLAKMFDGKGRSALNLMSVTGWLLIAAYFADFIPTFVGSIICGLISLTGYIIMLIAGSKMHADELPSGARGAGTLFLIAAIFYLFGTLIGLIPLLGTAIAAVFNFIAWLLALIGWVKFKNAKPTTGRAASAIEVYTISDARGGRLAYSGFLVRLIVALLVFPILVPTFITSFNLFSSSEVAPLYMITNLFSLIVWGLYTAGWAMQLTNRQSKVIGIVLMAACGIQTLVTIINIYSWARIMQELDGIDFWNPCQIIFDILILTGAIMSLCKASVHPRFKTGGLYLLFFGILLLTDLSAGWYTNHCYSQDYYAAQEDTFIQLYRNSLSLPISIISTLFFYLGTRAVFLAGRQTNDHIIQ